MAPTRPRLSPARMVMARAAQILYLLTGVAGILTIAMVLALQPTPNGPGWCLLVLGIVGFLGALTGLAGFQNDGCFIVHFIIQGISAFGDGATTISLFVSRPAILQGINLRSWPEDRVDNFLTGVRWAFLATLLMQTIEEQAKRRQDELGKIQKDIEAQNAKKQEGEAAKLAKKMREKYGKWANEDFGEH